MAAFDPEGLGINQVLSGAADKVAHFIATIFLSLLGLLAFPSFRAWLVFAAIAALAGLVEIAHFFGARSANWSDVFVGLAGVAVVAVAYYSSDLRGAKPDHDVQE